MTKLKILEDVRVIDLTQFWFGPFCTMMLADLGAEVIRIEPPWGSPDRVADGYLVGGSSYTFHQLNLNKKGLTLNLKTEEGLKIFKDIVTNADVVVQNFRPGTMERLGIGYEVLKEIKPEIIYAALSGFGQTGPYSERPCFAPIAEAMSGHTRLTGDKVDPYGPPIEMAQAVGDLGPALFATVSILAALRYRDRTGIGQSIDVAQLDCMAALNMGITGYNLSGLYPWQLREKYPVGKGFGGLFRTRDDKYVRIASFSPRLIDDLREYMEVEEVTEELLESRISGMSGDEAVKYFLKAKVPVAPVYQVDEVVEDPHLRDRNMFTKINHAEAGEIEVVNFPVKLSKSPVKIEKGSPVLGQHTEEVLKSLLGYSEIDVAKLAEKGVI
jgi:CoA:oxalate CoA-transferase